MENNLDKLIPQYAQNKSEMESYRKICDRENAEIKKIMLDKKLPEHIIGNYKATCTVSQRENMNEDILLEIFRTHDITGIIKTKEYVDFDALEKAIYDGKISEDVLLEMNKAKETKEVVILKVTKLKKKEEE